MSDTSLTGRLWYHNPTTQKHERIRVGEEIPEGFIRGRRNFNEDSKANYSSAKKGTKWYHNPTTKKNKRIKQGDDIPQGFIEGLVRYKTEQTMNWYYNETNGRIKQFPIGDDVPEEYTLGTRSRNHVKFSRPPKESL